MKSWAWPGAVALLCLLGCARDASAADDPTMFRVFLKDGRSLVSYGEFARVGDRVVFSMPVGSAASAPLHLVNLAADRIDWNRTDRYAVSARTSHYIATRADLDYAELSNQIAETLNAVIVTTEAAKRLAIVEQARKSLAGWPENHYNYRVTEVRQMLGMLDEAIADLRASTGTRRFDLNLVAYSAPLAQVEPLLPTPTLQEAIEQTLLAASLVESPVERTSLLAAALDGLDREKTAVDVEWAASTRSAVKATIDTELQLDWTYQSLTDRMLRLAGERARQADVRGIERLITGIRERDAALGAARPDAVNALIAAVEEKLDAARRLRLARDRWALRAPIIGQYRVAIRRPMNLFALIKPSLEDIKSLAGSSPSTLASIEQLVARIVKLSANISPPEEFQAAHALLVSAAQLAANAAKIRRDATLSNDIARAWDASSAAAGALMLGARARSEILTLLRLPQLR